MITTYGNLADAMFAEQNIKFLSGGFHKNRWRKPEPAICIYRG
jgi:hypothetical protein